MIEKQDGLLIVISGPSGVGKGTVCNKLAQDNADIFISVSATTRAPRGGEEDGINYFFYTEDKFKEMIKNDELMEWAVFCDNYYGTPKKAVFDKLKDGKNVILEIDVQGALKVKSKYPEGVYIFILPPSKDVLKERLSGRGTESDEVIEKRLAASVGELEQCKKYNYVVVNDTVDNAAAGIKAIISAEKARIERCKINF